MVKNKFFRKIADNQPQDVKTIAFVHHKGGTGKTTACLNIAGWLVKMRKKVLVVDLDPQGNATAGLGIDRESLDSSIYEVFFGQRTMEEVVLETDSGVYLAPSSIDLLAAETRMAGQADNTAILKTRMDGIAQHFDYALIDVSPGSTLLMINGIAASGNIIIPLDSGVFAYETLETLKTLILDLSDELGVEVNVTMMLLKGFSQSLFDTGPTREIRKLLKKFLTENNIEQVKLFTVPFSRAVYKAQMKGKPVSHYAPYSDAGRVYKRIAREIIRS